MISTMVSKLNLRQLAIQLPGLAQWGILSLVLGIAINILSFVSPLFMMQIMDSILPAQDQNTLIILFAFGAIAFGFMAALDGIRRTFSSRAAIWIEGRLTETVFSSGPTGKSDQTPRTSALTAVRQISAFMRNGANTIIDAPISTISFFVLWLIHPQFAYVALITASFMLMISFVRSKVTKNASVAAGDQRKSAMALADSLGEAEDLSATMGVRKNVERRFFDGYAISLRQDARISSRSEMLSSFSRFVRQLAQIIVLLIGALLVMEGQISGGAMIAGSIILGKALAPFDQLSAAWDAMMGAMAGANHLSETLSQQAQQQPLEKITPETIRPVLRVHNLTVPRGLGAAPILDHINFDLHPGECLAVVGMTGAGKTTLGEIIAATRSAPIGEVSLDGIPYDQLSNEMKSKIIGYVPQAVQYFPGSVLENISRFADSPNKDDVFDAVQRAEATDIIRSLGDGFDTVLDSKGKPLSIGSARRLTFARAIYGRPKLVVLDEPSSDLDELGEKAIVSLISTLKKEGAAIVLIAQRAGLLAVADKLMRLENGRLKDFGEKNQVLLRLSLRRQQIDLSTSLDEISRLIHWIGIHLARAEDGPLRARAEIAAVEVFSLLRQAEGINEHEKISIVINVVSQKVEFDIFCGLDQPIFDHGEDLGVNSQVSLYDTALDDPIKLSKSVLLNVVSDLKEEVVENRLRTSFSIILEEKPLQFQPEKIAV